MFAVSSRRVLPGFTLSLGTSLLLCALFAAAALRAGDAAGSDELGAVLGGDHQPTSGRGLQSDAAVSVCGINF